MHKVIIKHISPPEAIEFKNQLLAAGLVLDRDFKWEYHQATYNNDGFSAVTPKMVIFNFNDAPVATFYQLKWA